MRQQNKAPAPFYLMRATADERKRGQSDETVDSFHRAAYPSYQYWHECMSRDSEWELECQKRLRDARAELGDEMTPLATKELAALEQDLVQARDRKHYALEQMRSAA
jgi:hypothetical protein